MKYPDSVKDRLMQWSYVSPSGCWLWKGFLSPNGYASISINNKSVYAHRASYEAFVGDIPPTYTIDHLCRNRSCINPKHLEAVTFSENNARGNSISVVNSRKTHCKNGHPLSGDNLYIDKKGARNCRKCHSKNVVAWKKKKRLAMKNK